MDSTEEQQKEILRVLQELKSAPALNGAFDRLVVSVEQIKSTQGTLCGDLNNVMVKQAEARQTLDEMHVALYHPDTGIYKRINDTTSADENQEEHIERLEKQAGNLDKELNKHNERIIEVESVQDDLQLVAGNRMEHLDSAVKMQKNVKKLLWALLAASSALLIKQFGPMILAILL